MIPKRLGKRTEQLYAEAEKLQRQLDRYAYGPPPVRFTDQDVDQARAAGVLTDNVAPSRTGGAWGCAGPPSPSTKSAIATK